jgi:hypothetical protein
MSWFANLFGKAERVRLEAEARASAASAAQALELVRKMEEKLAATVPSAKEEIIDGVLTVTEWNTAYAATKRAVLPAELTNTMTDAEVVKVWVDRRNLELEDPRLEVVHSDITPDGQVKLQLEWNTAFIRLLQTRGFQGDTEDDLVQAYLHQVTNRTDTELFERETADVPLVPPTNDDDIEKILDNTNPDTLKALEKSIRRRAAQRGTRTRKLDK